ncbi:uncharacterized protein [Rhodnius prolixus]|uniref:RGS domain-containing protein n=1 Tax=Rhodnius prolixus TaxID=13249 RepID=A0A4P6D7E1_RHOPR
MSCAGQGGRTRQQVDRWTNSIHNLLASTEGRTAFRQYLLERSFTQEERTLLFWEVLDETQDLINRNATTKEIHENICKLIQLANDEDVNLDLSQMRELRKCKREQDMTVLRETLERAKDWTVQLLRERYRDFADKLLEKYS